MRLTRSRPLMWACIVLVLFGNAVTRSSGSDALFYTGAVLTLLGGGGAVTLLVLWLVDRFDQAHPPVEDGETGASGPR